MQNDSTGNRSLKTVNHTMRITDGSVTSVGRKTRKKKKRKTGKRIFLVAMCLVFVLLIAHCITYIGDYCNPNIFGAQSANGITINLNHLKSKNMILINPDNDHTILSKNSQDKIYPASLTKIMTALIAIEESGNLNATMTMPSDFYDSLYAQQASMAGFVPGEKVTIMDLLYGVILPSGADCCMALAEHISGNESAFVKLMNEKAKTLGMDHTNFKNCTGLHDTKHYTTVEDMAKLLQYALKNETFRKVFTTRRYTTATSKVHPDGITFYSTMFKALDDAEVKQGVILGGKTGYTDEAGLCLASLASIHGKEYILVTAKADGSHNTEQYHIDDAVYVYNQIGEK